jgi:hypothetical protein
MWVHVHNCFLDMLLSSPVTHWIGVLFLAAGMPLDTEIWIP